MLDDSQKRMFNGIFCIALMLTSATFFVPLTQASPLDTLLFVGEWHHQRTYEIEEIYVFKHGGKGTRIVILPWGEINKDITWKVKKG